MTNKKYPNDEIKIDLIFFYKFIKILFYKPHKIISSCNNKIIIFF